MRVNWEAASPLQDGISRRSIHKAVLHDADCKVFHIYSMSSDPLFD